MTYHLLLSNIACTIIVAIHMNANHEKAPMNPKYTSGYDNPIPRNITLRTPSEGIVVGRTYAMYLNQVGKLSKGKFSPVEFN